MEDLKMGFGAIASEQDSRTIQHTEMTTMGGVPLSNGGFDYAVTDIEHQHKVGICTAISLTQNAAKALGRKFSADFQYLLQKKYYDKNWYEGSSIFNALKVGKNFGFLPVELFNDPTGIPYINPDFDRVHMNPGSDVYSTYIAKLKAIPDQEITRLLTLCSNKLAGYASVDVTDPQKIATAINTSKAGILCMYRVGDEWYTAVDGTITWDPQFINPLRSPSPATSAHAITYAKFDYTQKYDGIHANTWGTDWNKHGLGDIIFSNYKPVEGWIPYYALTPDELAQIQDIKNRNAIVSKNVTDPAFLTFLRNYCTYLISLITGA